MLRVFFLTALVALSSVVARADVHATIKALAPSGLVYVVDSEGTVLVSQNADDPFVPASVAKIVTGWLALEELGADYRFETGFYVDDARVLFVRGGGDPFLVSEEIALLAPRLLEAAGDEPFTSIRLDVGHFPDRVAVPGVENNGKTYNASISALAANFNTIFAIRDGDSVRSAEEQTPITPLAISQFRARGPNGRARISLAQEDPSLSSIYVGELLSVFIEEAGGSVSGPISIGDVPDGLEPIYVHEQSRPLSELVRLMLLGSNNFMANQIFLQAGTASQGSPVSIEKSQKALEALLAPRDLTEGIRLVEGSGISRQNSMTAQGMAALLEHFAPYAELLSATRKGSRYKTGTLDDVSTLAGFAETEEHGMTRFVIALPGGSGRLRFTILNAIEDEL
ncbi:MAG: D-alanyl-D-alanine carboxypeptidase [Pseudomonadota bacterium]